VHLVYVPVDDRVPHMARDVGLPVGMAGRVDAHLRRLTGRVHAVILYALAALAVGIVSVLVAILVGVWLLHLDGTL
jgi:hypothetical protein